ncbi:MAG TPA: hypothetical protein DIW47_12175 [Bacteroidetes bacterium]|nr:hypothetical protein [Bacteroidota bacterium]
MFDMKIGSFATVNGQAQVVILGSHILAAYQDGAASTTSGNGLGLNILNNSWGLHTGADPKEFEKGMRAIQFAYKMKCTILFASGNDGADAMVATLIPGLLPDGWSILIGGTDVSGVRVWNGWGANYSSRLDHACAATDDLLFNIMRNTLPQNVLGSGTKYDDHNGTSFAVPQATGVAGIVMGYIKENGGPILAIEDVEKIIELGSEYFTSPTGVQTGYETGRGHGRINATKTAEFIEASQFRLYHINSDNSAFTSTYSVGSSPVSSYKAINLVDGIVPGVTGDARADIYYVTCSTSFTTPIALYNSIYYWPRHSYADGYQNYVSDIRTVSGVPDLYYQSETYNSVSLSFVDGATSGTAQFSSYFYKVTEVKGVTLSTPVWYPFDPSVTNPKFGFTIFGSTWPTSIEDVEEFDNKLYPNPTNQLINIEVDPEFSSTSVDVSIYTSTGALVKRETFKSDGATITMDVNNYIPGIYFVHLEADGRKQYFKVVKTK